MKIRNCARAIIMNSSGEILLQRFEFKNVVGNKILWVTPGGGIEENENYKLALERELFEELSLKIKINEKPIFIKDVIIDGKEEKFISHEVYYKIKLSSHILINLNNMTENEKNAFKDIKWWNKEELKQRKDFVPIEIIDLM